MKEVVLALPTFAFTVFTRGALGLGVGLLVSEHIPVERRRRIGGALVALGAATTVPILMTVRRSLRRRERQGIGVGQSEGLIGTTRFARKGDDELY